MSLWEMFLLGILAGVILITSVYQILVFFMERDANDLKKRMKFYFESLNDEEQKEYRLIVKNYKDLVIKVSKTRTIRELERENRRVSRLEKRKRRIENKIGRIRK